MAIKKMEAIIRIRRGTYTQWYSSNPILSEGEISYVTSGQDSGKFKIGDGKATWRDLRYSAARFPEDVITLLDEDVSNTLPNSGRIDGLFQSVRNFLKWTKGLFDPWTGHAHNGSDSPKVSYNDLADQSVIENFVIGRVNDEAAIRSTEIDIEKSVRATADHALGERINRVENLGHYAGAFDTYAILPKNTSGFPQGITVNDFTTIRSDETHDGAVTRYVVSEIDDKTGDITWIYDVTYTADISGKTDKVAGAASGNFAGLDAEGNLTNSGKSASDFEDIRADIQKINEDYVNEGDIENAVSAHNQNIASHNELSNALLEKINSKIDEDMIGRPNGVASLDPQAKVPLDQLPDVIAGDFNSLIDQLEAKQDKITATGTTNLLTAPAESGGQPGVVPINMFYPVGSIYMSVKNVSPAEWLEGTTWTVWGSGRVPVGVNTSDSAFSSVEMAGGAKTHTLTISEMPSHTHVQNSHSHGIPTSTSDDNGSYNDVGNKHSQTNTTNSATATNQNTGGGGAHNNLQPYITCYFFKRTA